MGIRRLLSCFIGLVLWHHFTMPQQQVRFVDSEVRAKLQLAMATNDYLQYPWPQ